MHLLPTIRGLHSLLSPGRRKILKVALFIPELLFGANRLSALDC